MFLVVIVMSQGYRNKFESGGLNHEVDLRSRGLEAQPPEAVEWLLIDNLKVANYSILQENIASYVATD